MPHSEDLATTQSFNSEAEKSQIKNTRRKMAKKVRSQVDWTLLLVTIFHLVRVQKDISEGCVRTLLYVKYGNDHHLESKRFIVL